MSKGTWDGFKLASIFSRWLMCGGQECVQSPSWGAFIIPRTMAEGMSVQFYQCSCRQTDLGMDFCLISWLVMEKGQRGAPCTFTSQPSDVTYFFMLVIQTYTNSMLFIQNISWIHLSYKQHVFKFKFLYFWGATVKKVIIIIKKNV